MPVAPLGEHLERAVVDEVAHELREPGRLVVGEEVLLDAEREPAAGDEQVERVAERAGGMSPKPSAATVVRTSKRVAPRDSRDLGRRVGEVADDVLGVRAGTVALGGLGGLGDDVDADDRAAAHAAGTRRPCRCRRRGRAPQAAGSRSPASSCSASSAADDVGRLAVEHLVEEMLVETGDPVDLVVVVEADAARIAVDDDLAALGVLVAIVVDVREADLEFGQRHVQTSKPDFAGAEPAGGTVEAVELAPTRPNVELRDRPARASPSSSSPSRTTPTLVDAMRAIPGRRFDWDRRSGRSRGTSVTAVYVADVLARWPRAASSPTTSARGCAGAPSGWLGRVTTRKRAGEPGSSSSARSPASCPTALAALPTPTATTGARSTLPFTAEAADALLDEAARGSSSAAIGCATRLQVGLDAAARRARRRAHGRGAAPGARGAVGPRHRRGVRRAARAPSARSRTLPIDPWALEPLEALPARARRRGRRGARARPRAAAARARRGDRGGPPLARAHGRAARAGAARLGGELAPFQWAGVRYVLDARRTFLADEQGLGKTVQALAALEADDAFPAVVVCPASLKLTWEREARALAAAPHARGGQRARRGVAPRPTSRSSTTRSSPATATRSRGAGRARSCSTSRTTARTRGRSARRRSARLAKTLPRRRAAPRAHRHAGDEPRPRRSSRSCGSSAGSTSSAAARGSSAASPGPGAEERLHWHLRRRVLRAAAARRDVLPQLPAKRQVVVPVALDNEDEYRLAERDVVAWLR